MARQGKVHNQDVSEMVQTDLGVVTQEQLLNHEFDSVDVEIESNVLHKNETEQRLADLAFNEEYLVIQISEGTAENDEKLVPLWVNGEGAGPNGIPYIPRGVPVRIKRKFVERLARARPVMYDSKEVTNERGERTYVNPSRTGLKYPFAVIEDENPKGRAWLQAIIRER